MVNAIEKIIAAHCGRETVHAGEIVDVEPDWIMINDATSAHTIDIFHHRFGGEKVADPDKVVFVLDHYTPSSSIDAAHSHAITRQFAAQQGVRVYDGCGICHQLMLEHHVLPGQLIIGADSHTCTYGALAAPAAGMGSTDIAGAMKEGTIWMKVPETCRISVSGEWPVHVHAKDLALKIIGDLTVSGATYKTLYFDGAAIEALEISGRMTLANMVIEAGAKFAYFNPDHKTARFLKERGRKLPYVAEDDPNTEWFEEYNYDVSDLVPQVAVPHSVDNVHDVRDVEGTSIDECFLGACTNGRFEDLEIAAQIMEGKQIAAGVRFLVTPASTAIYLRAMEAGLLKVLMQSGAMVSQPGCSACFGGTGGILGKGEKLLTSANRNFRGRVGHADSEIYLASPAVVAASALTGKITDPGSIS